MSTSTENRPIRAGVFVSMDHAENAVRQLLNAGFQKDQITVICSDKSKERHFGSLHHHDGLTEVDHPGTAKSGIVGGLLGGLMTLAGVATTGGLGIVAVGPVLGGSIAGTLLGIFVGRGVEDELARFYDQAVTKGNLLVAVEVDDPDNHADQLAKAAKLLKESGAEPFALDEG